MISIINYNAFVCSTSMNGMGMMCVWNGMKLYVENSMTSVTFDYYIKRISKKGFVFPLF